MGHNFGVGALAIVGLFLIAGQVKSENDWESIRAQSRLSEKINRFSFSLFHSLIESDHGIARDENAAISPINVWMLLSVASNGASGYTKREMEQALFWKNTPEEQLALAALHKTYADVYKKWEVDSIHTIFYNNSYNIKSTYNDMVRNQYNNEIKSVDFSRTDDTLNEINNWADHESRSHIKDFMPKVKFNSSFSMLLVSGTHIRGIWAVPFHETSTKRAFLMSHGNTHEVPMLHAYGIFSVGYLFPDYSAKIIKIDYEGGYVSNYIVMPYDHNSADLVKFEKNLRFMTLNDFETHYYAKKMNLYVPKLRINSTFCLERSLRKLGMNKMWTREAEFTDVNTEDKPMWANKVFHKASIVVDEYNNASTTFEPNNDAENFYVDRPFYMLTVYRGVVVFMTRIVDATSLF